MAKVFVLRRSRELPENGISAITASRNQKAIPEKGIAFWWRRGTYPRVARERRGAIKTNRVRAKVYVLRRSRELPKRYFCNYLFAQQKGYPLLGIPFAGGALLT